jgi:hypothetical protein
MEFNPNVMVPILLVAEILPFYPNVWVPTKVVTEPQNLIQMSSFPG